MNHWVLFPSANPVRGMRCAAQWRRSGYNILVMLDPGKESLATMPGNTHIMTAPSPFPGYYSVINSMCDKAFKDYGADLVTCIGDDMLPPSQGAEEHTRLYFLRFPAGDGVMQCTGDRQGELIGGKVNSERICGSPTFGRRWYERAFDGKGPFPQGFHSFFADEFLKEAAEHAGLLYQEPALTIFHAHWSWGHTRREDYHKRAQMNWDADQETFRRRKAEGFKGAQS